MNDAKCIFCRIVAGEIPAKKVFETDSVFAFRDINPQAPVHVLVIPKRHIVALSELENGAGEIFAAVREVAKVEGIDSGGFRTVLNQGPDAGQEVDHIHFHVLGGRRLKWIF